jgi:hypothetical protein
MRAVLLSLLNIHYSRTGQLQPTGGPHNLLRTRMRAAPVYTYVEGREGGTDDFNRRPLFTNNNLR